MKFNSVNTLLILLYLKFLLAEHKYRDKKTMIHNNKIVLYKINNYYNKFLIVMSLALNLSARPCSG